MASTILDTNILLAAVVIAAAAFVALRAEVEGVRLLPLTVLYALALSPAFVIAIFVEDPGIVPLLFPAPGDDSARQAVATAKFVAFADRRFAEGAIAALTALLAGALAWRFVIPAVRNRDEGAAADEAMVGAGLFGSFLVAAAVLLASASIPQVEGNIRFAAVIVSLALWVTGALGFAYASFYVGEEDRKFIQRITGRAAPVCLLIAVYELARHRLGQIAEMALGL